MWFDESHAYGNLNRCILAMLKNWGNKGTEEIGLVTPTPVLCAVLNHIGLFYNSVRLYTTRSIMMFSIRAFVKAYIRFRCAGICTRESLDICSPGKLGCWGNSYTCCGICSQLLWRYWTPQDSSHIALWWRHDGRDGVTNHQHHHCLLNRLFKAQIKEFKHQISASLVFVGGIHWWPVNSPHKGPVTRKMFPLDDVIILLLIIVILIIRNYYVYW